MAVYLLLSIDRTSLSSILSKTLKQICSIFPTVSDSTGYSEIILGRCIVKAVITDSTNVQYNDIIW